MEIFKLPDLGEGLAEAEIREWYVKEGDEVKNEQPLCSVETAKAVVDVPSPHEGKIIKLYGKVGDIIKTGAPLIEFASEKSSQARSDAGTVVGRLESGHKILNESATGIQTSSSTTKSIKASPAVRALAKELNIDLTTVTPTGPGGSITLADVKQQQPTTTHKIIGEQLKGARRSMALYMTQAHREIAPVTIMDYADIHHWPRGEDITLRIINALSNACAIEPALNAHFDGKNISRQLFKEVNLGIAVDTKEGLYVPVIKDVANKSSAELRKIIDKFKSSAQQQNFSPEDLQGATITLSNFGTIAGRYANPIIVLPCVAILGVGKISENAIAYESKPTVHRTMPLSLTFDHRAVTGGEAARFMAAVIQNLQS